MPDSLSPAPVKTALFLDFDNVYLSLQALNPQAAEIFATSPEVWLDWIASGKHVDDPTAIRRNILVRRCYLNPQVFWRHRTHFTRSAFNVVDCPPLTSTKNSADIYMVMDILDTLEHSTRFDEFVILSADADFTPVLLRLRTHDRRTSILANQLAAPAFKAACDTVIDIDDFIEEALGIHEERQGYDWVLPDVAARLRETIEAQGPLEASALATVFREFPSFMNSNWFGFRRLRPLAEKLTEYEATLQLTADSGHSWEVQIRGMADGQARKTVGGTRDDIIEAARRIVTNSPAPKLLASLGNELADDLGVWVKQSGWGGAGTLSSLLAGAKLPDLAVTMVHPMQAYDPNRHDIEDVDRIPPDLRPLVDSICKITGCPRLPTEDYRAIYEEIAAVANESPGMPMNEASRIIRDRLADKDVPVGRNTVAFVLQGLQVNGYVMEEGDEAQVVAQAFSDNVEQLCRNAGLELSDDERSQFYAWMTGG
ncbi:MAG TPA: NYN domain-containing protein [Candidatus Omnitrophota bacterium]|nr:NYN domain-containing protein [Candidatus Omnitrophota bacterium]